MLAVSSELQEKLQQLNTALDIQYPFAELKREPIRNLLKLYGELYQLKKWTSTETGEWLSGDALFAIDGSTNCTKSMPTRSVHLFQVLGKSTAGSELWSADVHTELLQCDSERSSMLATMELQMAIRVIDEWQPKVIMLDGSLLHFYTENATLFMTMMEKALKKDVLLIGVAEEMATKTLATNITPDSPSFSDADILCGTLHVGEAFIWNTNFFSSQGLWRVAVRSAASPHPIVVDGLAAQGDELIPLLNLVYALTPAQGRGIPLWLDIVDQQVRITDVLLEGLLDQFIDAQLRRRLFSVKRSERII